MSSKRNSLGALALLSALMGFASISTDLYLPALPAMAQVLGAGAGEMEWTISGFLIGFSLGQLVWGPLSDRYGRRGPVAAGLVIFALGSGGCALATSAGQIVVWRVVQAVGACAAVVLSRAMVRDLYEGEKSAQMMSTLMTVMAVAPLLGPLVGAQILAFASWRAIFWALVAVALVTLAALTVLPETFPRDRRAKESLGAAFRGYGPLLRDRRILGFAAAVSCFYVGVFAYLAGAPFAYISYYGVPPGWFGLLFGAAILAIMIANMLNVRLAPVYGSARLLRAGGLVAGAAGLALAFAGFSGAGGLAGLVAPLLVFNGASGLIVANALAGALAQRPERAGSVSALVGALHYGSGILGSGLVGAFADGTPRPMSLMVAAAGVGTALCAWTLVHPAQD
ncbi:DHA1 family bicyclomycin/chloramphenicol resistance-like MFS transporter [Rhodoblastus acidophilus]|uniref:multidrug effflux MFS transporter n=1 Tax=Rhodoblastus acidophilus TaxID=1074 RepID=UPI0022253A2E|nr:multidrug effflux MFS transporter [Rhodoblastus acidophilus]MCW2282276.1 DHA1 family bicyclomycin/chloramphenicol resistance-like MFS transporter [Rhodoblastus acidophilus]MCW2331319.1 DHA1 family bicyclomycin/chloramphenicol resistance-like MFS transporter [Rhodoblastus acidophilus]